ncbi:hypothetical protein QFC21_004131 [Naganishia friedmannii]|uniref:Uncharacterized protein n=1 Tax=Naganishia friedmannii TaxID=89922 RepID=A0ACC2VIN3_9TREE|nr:hypothetical protein QFC21_004131 [Naganishia friedmannii]
MPLLSQQIIALRPVPQDNIDGVATATVDDHVRSRIDQQFASWESLVGPRIGDEIQRLKKEEEQGRSELQTVQSQIRQLTTRAQERLQKLLEDAQGVSMSRWEVVDLLGRLERELLQSDGSSGGDGDGDVSVDIDSQMDGDGHKADSKQMVEVRRKESVKEGEADEARSVLLRLEQTHARLAALARGLRWIAVLEQVVSSRQVTALFFYHSNTCLGDLTPLLPHSQETLQQIHQPPTNGRRSSPLDALQGYKSLHSLVARMHASLPPTLFLLDVCKRVRADTWKGIKAALDKNLLDALTEIGWPQKVHYSALSVEKRKAFERAFRESCVWQLECETLSRTPPGVTEDPSDPAASRQQKSALSPFVVMAQQVAPRFRFHFEGERGTNRLDKPEWAFSHILDLVFEQRAFAEGYLQPLLHRSGFGQVDAMSEMIAQLLPLPLALLRHRFPHLLDHPALLAHTVYQTVVFDEAVRQLGFRYGRTWKIVGSRWEQDRGMKGKKEREVENEEWVGLTEQVLSTADWYDRWLAGEKQFADDQFNEIISSDEAWMIVPLDSTASGMNGVDEQNEAAAAEAEYRPTMGARKVKALIEQVADRYTSLPTLKHRYPFLATIQIPLLKSYHGRIAGSLDAFETLSSAFIRAVPGALSAHASGGSANDPARMTRGVGGLQRLAKAWISAAWVRDAIIGWQDEILYLELSAEIQADGEYSQRAIDDGIIGLYSRDRNVFELRLEEFNLLLARAEDLIIKHITHEVERDLKQHLTRRWDKPTSSEETRLDPALVSPLTTFSAQLAHLVRILPPAKSRKLYRSIVSHISNHIMQRAVYAGWSKFTETGGRELLSEVEAWIEASRHGLEDSNAIRFPEFAWTQLHETARVLALPKELTPEKSMTFSQATALVFGDDYHRFTESLGLKEMPQEQAQAVMRRRIECWR